MPCSRRDLEGIHVGDECKDGVESSALRNSVNCCRICNDQHVTTDVHPTGPDSFRHISTSSTSALLCPRGHARPSLPAAMCTPPSFVYHTSAPGRFQSMITACPREEAMYALELLGTAVGALADSSPLHATHPQHLISLSTWQPRIRDFLHILFHLLDDLDSSCTRAYTHSLPSVYSPSHVLPLRKSRIDFVLNPLHSATVLPHPARHRPWAISAPHSGPIPAQACTIPRLSIAPRRVVAVLLYHLQLVSMIRVVK